MTALKAPEFEINNAQELAELLVQSQSWREIQFLTTNYAQWKQEAWFALSKGEQERIKKLKKWSNHPVAKEFPLGSTVQRVDDTEEQRGKVIDYWSAYDVDYVTFKVGSDIDWCRADNLKLIFQ